VFDALLRIIALTFKELLATLKDRHAQFSIFVPPVLQCLIYGYVASYDLNDIPYAVLDRDRSPASTDLLARLDGSKTFHRVANLEQSTDVKKFIDEGRALLVIQIDQDFERKLLGGQGAELQVVADGRNSNTAGTATGYIGEVVESFNLDWRAEHAPLGAPSLPGGANGTINVVARAWYNPNLETRWNMIPGLIGTLTMMEVLLLTAMSIAREREQGTFDQLLVTPFRPAEIMAGKTIPPMLIGIVQATMVLLVAQLWFRIPFAGSFIVLYAGMTLFLLAAVGLGLLVSAFAGTMQQAMLYSFVVMMPFILMSGLTTPISSMPEVLQYVTLINPLRYAIEIAHRVYLEGAGLSLLSSQLWPLGLIALVTLSVASWLFRRGLE
jgi:ABC-2 type transport system permease protein